MRAPSPSLTPPAARDGARPLTNATIVKLGFYRHSDEPTVYYVRSQSDACVVLTMEQMEAYGGLAQVKVVAPSVDFLSGVARPVPACKGATP
jgi:hypothetical protein